jgi:hypothetical protein
MTNKDFNKWVSQKAQTFLAPNGPCWNQSQVECIVQGPGLVGDEGYGVFVQQGFGYPIPDTGTLSCLETQLGGSSPVQPVSATADQADEIPMDSTPATCQWLGTWTGPVDQVPSPGFPYNVTMNITSVAGSTGSVVGTDTYSVFGCTGQLTLVSVSQTTLELHETITQQGSAYTCIDGDITLTDNGDGTLQYKWTGGGYMASAQLTRTPG